MSPLDATWHLLNALAAPLGLALFASVLTWLLWGRGVAGLKGPAGLKGLVLWSYCAALTAHLGVWAWVGAEGSILGYALMVVAVALVLWWRVFLSARP